jgi:FG-GAP-like repeat/FG-GAP repeat
MHPLRKILTLSAAISLLGAGAAHASVPDAGGGVRATSPADLAGVLNSDYKGRIVIPRDVFWDMKGADGAPLRELPVKSGVEIVGERGALASRPTLYLGDATTEAELLKVVGNDVRIHGVRFVGPKPPSRHATRTPYVHAISVEEDFDAQTGRRVLVDDNEFERWSGAGVNIYGTHQVKDPKDWDASWKKPQPSDASLVRVERNDMHDNVMDGGGYGFVVGGGAYATAEGNVFDNNRHAVAASGKAYSGYVARFNYVLHNGTKQGSYYNQHFDVHGVGDGGYGGSAGTYYDISFNTIRGDQSYYLVKTRPALMLRGRPTIGMFFHDNVAVHGDLDSAVSLKGQGGLSELGIGEDQGAYNFRASGNRFDTDYSTEIASGDFDGDGQKDVFVANGTGWWFSRAGVRQWELLHESTKRTGQLAFADIDNDGKTDVLYRDGAGNLGYLSGGTADLKPLTTLPVAIGDLRFGDFDGDGKTDMFSTRNGQWMVWYGRTRTWTPTQTSSAKIGQLLFGDFDGVRGTDVATVLNQGWSISSASTGSWARINAKLAGSFDNAAVADFDGDGRDDIAVGTSSSWRYSAGGRAPLATLRTGSGLSNLKDVQLGRFNTGPRAIAVAFVGDRLAHWKGLGAASAFYTRSLQDMR